MAKIRINIDQAAIDRLTNRAAGKKQQSVTAQGRRVISEVGDEMRGRPVDEVLAELTKRITALGAKPNEENLRKYAEQISGGTFQG